MHALSAAQRLPGMLRPDEKTLGAPGATAIYEKNCRKAAVGSTRFEEESGILETLSNWYAPSPEHS